MNTKTLFSQVYRSSGIDEALRPAQLSDFVLITIGSLFEPFQLYWFRKDCAGIS